MVESSSGSRSASPAVLAALRELQVEYGKVLPGVVAKLAGEVREAKGGGGAGLQGLRGQAHKLRGTSGSYGFLGVSEAAGRFEQAVLRALAAPGEDEWAAIEAAVEEIGVKAAEAAASVSQGGS